MRTLLLCLPALILSVLVLQGCGEQPQVVAYKQGRYQGKPDTRPWDNEAFQGSKTEWEKAIKTRNLGQNEYKKEP